MNIPNLIFAAIMGGLMSLSITLASTGLLLDVA
jgi:hypothetical protein